MRSLDEILTSIENAKMDISSNEYIQVKMEDLESLYEHIQNREDLLSATNTKVEELMEKVELLNELATMKHKRLDKYI